MNIPEINANELFRRLNLRTREEDSFILLDVRNENESEICSIPGTDFLIPIKSLKNRISEIEKTVPKTKDIIVYCKSGIRSLAGAENLLEDKFQKVYNLTGGILSYIKDIDSELPVY